MNNIIFIPDTTDSKYSNNNTVYNTIYNSNNPNAMFELYYLLMDSNSEDPNMMISLLEKAVILNHTYSMIELASIYKNENNRFNKYIEFENIPKAIELYEKAISLGNKAALYNLAYTYTFNKPKQNFSKAIELCNKYILLSPNEELLLNSYYMLASIYGNIDELSDNNTYLDIPLAIKIINIMISINPNYIRSSYGLFYIYSNYEEYKDTRKASQYLEQIIFDSADEIYKIQTYKFIEKYSYFYINGYINQDKYIEFYKKTPECFKMSIFKPVSENDRIVKNE